VGGDFTSFDKTNCNHIARLLPRRRHGHTFLPSSGIGVTNGTDQDVHAVAVDNLGKISWAGILPGSTAPIGVTSPGC
jgi:hypothetical protein